MPIITIEGGAMNKEQKEALIQRLTQASSEILKIPEQSFVVILKENDADNVGTGGKMLSKVLAERQQE